MDDPTRDQREPGHWWKGCLSKLQCLAFWNKKKTLEKWLRIANGHWFYFTYGDTFSHLGATQLITLALLKPEASSGNNKQPQQNLWEKRKKKKPLVAPFECLLQIWTWQTHVDETRSERLMPHLCHSHLNCITVNNQHWKSITPGKPGWICETSLRKAARQLSATA